MTKTEMIDILRGKKLLKAPENNDELLEGLKMLDTIFDEIADELEQSERVVRCRDCKFYRWEQDPCHGKTIRLCDRLNVIVNSKDGFCSCGKRKDEVSE